MALLIIFSGLLFAASAAVAAGGDPCNSTIVYHSQRSCGGSGWEFNGVNSTEDCAAKCCAHPASSPFAIDGCVAWSLNGWNQCFLCKADRKTGAVPPPKPAGDKCDHDGGTNCSTGVVTPPTPPPLPPAPLTGPLGGEASVEYVNYARGLRWPSKLNGSAFARVELDASGWPTADCVMVVFDDRPTHAWAPPMDDPEKRQADLAGDWTLLITGNADKVSLSDPGTKGITLGKSSYDKKSNTLTVTVTIAKGKYPQVSNLVVLKFEGTQANATAAKGSGFTGLRFIMPGYAAKPTQLFSDNWAALMKPFDHLRWMGTTGACAVQLIASLESVCRLWD